MKNKRQILLGFTLIEILVSITILSIILISVFSIYISSTNINLKTDITRALQQNVKSTVEMISEDIRKNGFDCVKQQYTDACILPTINKTNDGVMLQIAANSYYLAQYNGTNYTWVQSHNCDEIDEKCTLVMNDGGGAKPIMNSWVDVKDIKFFISNTGVKKATIVMKLQPAIGKGIKPQLIKDNTFYFQTTISERGNLD